MTSVNVVVDDLMTNLILDITRSCTGAEGHPK